jgi:hypothetical protein
MVVLLESFDSNLPVSFDSFPFGRPDLRLTTIDWITRSSPKSGELRGACSETADECLVDLRIGKSNEFCSREANARRYQLNTSMMRLPQTELGAIRSCAARKAGEGEPS